MPFNRLLDRVEIIEKDGQFVVIDMGGRVQARWNDEHHAKEHKNLINSLIDGAENASKERKHLKDDFKQYRQVK